MGVWEEGLSGIVAVKTGIAVEIEYGVQRVVCKMGLTEGRIGL